MAGLWTESCLQMAALSAPPTGYQVYIVTDASGGSKESHGMAVKRMIQAGAIPLTAGTFVKEMQRDWSRPTAAAMMKIYEEHGGAYGEGLRWEWELLGLKEGTCRGNAPRCNPLRIRTMCEERMRRVTLCGASEPSCQPAAGRW